jgi:hypothetical protein
MNNRQYSIARSKAMRWRGPSVPTRFYLGRGIPADLPSAPTAIYIAELDDGRCAYVGQTRQGTATRLMQHATRWSRSTRWTAVWVVPILDEVPDRELDRIEGRIGRLLRPTETVRLPRTY